MVRRPALAMIAVILCLLAAMSVEGSNPKRGLAFVPGNEKDLGKASGGQCSWLYNWAATPPASVPSGLDFVPMQWGRDNVSSFADIVRNASAKTILGFNEPDMPPPQSNIPAGEAAQLWRQYIEPLKSDGVRLGSPAISSGPSGLPWLTEFMQACSNCTIDFIVVHWYGNGTENFEGYLQSVHAKFSQPMWITEFADTGNSSDTTTFMTAALPYLDDPSQSWVERYSWFAFARNLTGLQSNLLDGSGNLNALGTSYIAGSRARRGNGRRTRQSIDIDTY
ncbi:hypothetical protein DFH07DRAFT_567523 [Mycena maculata]|uniref:Asl1-like glycosyl hydrolase catalytic domain-containing protein n=1 Tax=Mycena maculata TaxID=230809 RepID=A0AAD7K8D7_9AGAR|nr:hypothetical protein DFH07DRAFT_567523 [Mycena maculata]